MYHLAMFGREPVDLKAVRRWLIGRKHWETTSSEHLYFQNTHTGVAFPIAVDETATGGAGSPPMTALLATGRPSFFVREIDPELTALIEEFGLFIHEPRSGLTGVYEPDALRSGWLAANTVEEDDEPPSTKSGRTARLPTEKLTAMWAWNSRVVDLQFRVGEEVYVPYVVVSERDGAAFTTVAWPDGFPTLLPRVDAVTVWRDHLAPRAFGIGERKTDIQFVPWDDVAERIRPHATPRADGGFNYVPRVLPDEVQNWLRKLPRGMNPDVTAIVSVSDLRDEVRPLRLDPL